MQGLVTVLTAATVTNLTTLATVKSELGIKTAKDDARLARWLADASAQVTTYLNRTLARETVSEVFTQAGGGPFSCGSHDSHRRERRTLRLSRYPVVPPLASITVDGIALDPSEWRLDPGPGLVTRLSVYGSPIEWWGREIIAVYTAGYALLGDLPREIEMAVLSLIRLRHATVDRDPTIKSEDVPGAYAVTYWLGGLGENAAIPPEAVSLLADHREVRL